MSFFVSVALEIDPEPARLTVSPRAISLHLGLFSYIPLKNT